MGYSLIGQTTKVLKRASPDCAAYGTHNEYRAAYGLSYKVSVPFRKNHFLGCARPFAVFSANVALRLEDEVKTVRP